MDPVMSLIVYLVLFVIVAGLSVLGVSNFYLYVSYRLEKSSKASKKYLFYALALFMLAPSYVVFIINKLASCSTDEYMAMTLYNRPAIAIFILSSLFGLAVFCYLLTTFLTKRLNMHLSHYLWGR